jgi:hypothetical protein
MPGKAEKLPAMSRLRAISLPGLPSPFRDGPVPGQIAFQRMVGFFQIKAAAMNTVMPARKVEKSRPVVSLPSPEKSVFVTVMTAELLIQSVKTKETGPGEKKGIQMVTNVFSLFVQPFELVKRAAGIFPGHEFPQSLLRKFMVEVGGKYLVGPGHNNPQVSSPALIPLNILIDTQV